MYAKTELQKCLDGEDFISNSIIGAGSIVNKNIPPNSIAVGNPCKRIRSLA